MKAHLIEFFIGPDEVLSNSSNIENHHKYYQQVDNNTDSKNNISNTKLVLCKTVQESK